MARRKTTSPGKIRSTTREANELAAQLTRILSPLLGDEAKANRLARKVLLHRMPLVRAKAAKKVQELLGATGANLLHKLVIAKTTFRNDR